MPEPEQYPKWKFHISKPALIVNDAAAEAALGEGWYDHPDEPRKQAQPVKTDLSDLQRMPRRK